MKPFIKWVGGKTQIIDQIIPYIHNEIDTFYDLFLGGGSVLIYLLENNYNIKHYKVYDINEALIYCYINIRDNCTDLINSLEIIKTEYIDSENKEEYYYKKRIEYNNTTNKKDVKCSTLFIFLNKTCFRGLYREGKNGFNVTKPCIYEEENLRNISNLIKNVEFICSDFKNVINTIKIKDNDFFYIDPPYIKENEKSFVKYTNNSFNNDETDVLINFIKKLNCKFLLHNSNSNIIKEQFKEYNISELLCKRRINSKEPNSNTIELIITKK